MDAELQALMLRQLASGMPADTVARLVVERNVARDQLAFSRVVAARGLPVTSTVALVKLLDFLAPAQRERATPERPSTTTQLSDGTVGYFVRASRTPDGFTARMDDCFAAALATTLQVPIDDVPDPRFDERVAAGEDAAAIEASAWRSLLRWLADRGLRLLIHTEVPVQRERWIGVVGSGRFNSHCVVMRRDEILFDPVDQRWHWRPLRRYAAADVTSGFSFDLSQPTRRA